MRGRKRMRVYLSGGGKEGGSEREEVRGRGAVRVMHARVRGGYLSCLLLHLLHHPGVS